MFLLIFPIPLADFESLDFCCSCKHLGMFVKPPTYDYDLGGNVLSYNNVNTRS
jgi:hypothetical protein